MLKKVVVSGLVAIIIGAVGVGVYAAWQSRGFDNRVPRVEAARGNGGRQERYEDSVVWPQDGGQGQRGRQNEPEDSAISSQGSGQGQKGRQNEYADSAVWAQGSGQGSRGRQNEIEPLGLTSGSEMAQRGTQSYRGGQGATEPRGLVDGSEMPQPQVEVDEWLTLTGVVVSLEQTRLTLTTDDGQTLTLELGPPWFWSSQGVNLQVGDAVEVLGFEADESYGLIFQTATITRLSDGATLQLRDPNGRPLWTSGRRTGL